MAVDPTIRLTKTMVEALSDSRTNVVAAANAVIAEADRNNFVQVYLWQFVVAYLYNRTARHDLGLAFGDNQEYVCKRASEMVWAVLEPEYHTFRGSGEIKSGHVDLTLFD